MNLAALTLLAALGAAAIDLPSGQTVRIRLGQAISSETAKTGDQWNGTLDAALVVKGKTVARRHAPVEGVVAEARASGRLSDTAILRLELTSLDGQRVQSNRLEREGESHTSRNTKAIGGGAVAGAIIGAIAGGGKGAAVGAGVGAAAGTAGAAATGKKDIRYPVETVLTFTLR
ncbi:MAG: hypothetical protein ACRD96_24600 [Bryobacteraceae bacterium]